MMPPSPDRSLQLSKHQSWHRFVTFFEVEVGLPPSFAPCLSPMRDVDSIDTP